ncbi:MAG TPA: LOG family protein [Microthrixaceae bacterium]|jgi:uncharacterized protein (TIGR00730 family)|nr:LOG family protein [Microthrixaceae bacterium]
MSSHLLDTSEPAGPDPTELRCRIHAALEELGDDASDLAMAASVLEDLAGASRILSQLNHQPKVTIFGSARVREDSPAYQQVQELAGLLSADGFTIVTGGGPGVMAAGLRGAAPGRAVGVSIALPFETPHEGDFPVVLQDRFFTRKLAMVRHVRGFVAAAGGFGTADEVLEVLVLLQTGKKRPAPVVLLDPPGQPQWARFAEWVRDELVPAGLISPADLSLFRVCDDVHEAHREITRFYSRYQRLTEHVLPDGRYAMVLSDLPDADELTRLAVDFADLCGSRGFEVVDSAEGPVLAFEFDRRRWGRLRQLIDRLNGA